jgi:hypothetical protein
VARIGLRQAFSTISAPFSPSAMVGALVLDDGIVGKIEESITLSPLTPRTLSSGSTTASPSSPARQLPTMCQVVWVVSRI